MFRCYGKKGGEGKKFKAAGELTPSMILWHDWIWNGASCGCGMGVTTASTPVRVTFSLDKARQFVKDLAALISSPDGEFHRHMRQHSIQISQFQLMPYPKRG